ncbi:hypothetical protein QFC21_000419 [Naganishia friedmannii]|uniref:Uncharacterized protein n=1 Tax=Naganishia friedmannii TaxID=89922 RepID=A0ACC2WE04_9TREE|nr:hypothetical protein QFC21_000419 [Naganishia friedmannii]
MSTGQAANNNPREESSHEEQAVPPSAKLTRSYRACINCRTHKTKCDLGDVNNPIPPPCSRCKRERKECVFGESKRGGRANIDAGLAKRKGTSEAPGITEETHIRDRRSEDADSAIRPPPPLEKSQTQPFPLVQARQQEAGQLSTLRPTANQTSSDIADHHFPEMSVYDMEPYPLPMLQQATANMRHSIPAPLPLQSHDHAAGMSNDFPMNMDDIDMSFVFNGNPHITRSLQKNQVAVEPNVTLPSIDRPGDTSNQNMGTGPSFSGLFSSPNASPGTSIHPNGTSNRPGKLAIHERQASLDHLVSSRPRRLSTSTNDSAKKEREQEKLALKDARSFIVNAGMHNESDALQILAMAAETQNSKKRKRDYSASVDSPIMEINDRRESERDMIRSSGHGKEADNEGAEVNGSGRINRTRRHTPPNHSERVDVAGPTRVTFRDSSSFEREPSPTPVPDITQFFLVEQGILDPEQVHDLCRTFFAKHHHYFPLIPPNRIPRDANEMTAFAVREPYLITAFIIIASKYQTSHSARRIHEQTWNLMKGILAEVNFQGVAPTVGLVEGVLLLAENLPRERIVGTSLSANDKIKPKMPLISTDSDEQREVITGAENRQAWMLIGGAIRMAYGLGLDQLARQMDGGTVARHRATIAWTYCYIFDRQISIRTGRAFWSRGPALCFRGYSHVEQTGPAGGRENFPLLCDTAWGESHQGPPSGEMVRTGTESAELLQAYVELTQSHLRHSVNNSLGYIGQSRLTSTPHSMTNVHDVFYPSETRTHSLVKAGEYFFNNALESFKITWSRKQWQLFPHGPLVWSMFHYTRLYSSSFAFQAHITRSAERAKDRMVREDGGKDLIGEAASATFFPRSSAFTPDALYIYEAINAGRQLLEICINELYPEDVLQYLPSRYLLWFQYAAVFLLKAVYSGAMVQSDHVTTLVLVERLCNCLVICSKDVGHPAARYGKLVRALASRLAAQNNSVAPSRNVSPEPTVTKSGGSPRKGPTLNSQNHNTMENSPMNLADPFTGQQPILGHLFPFGSLDQGRMTETDPNRISGGMVGSWNHSATEAEQNELLRWLLEEPAAQTSLFDFNFV